MSNLRYHVINEEMDNKYIKRYSISLIIKKIKNKATMSYHFTLSGMLKSKGQIILNVSKDVK